MTLTTETAAAVVLGGWRLPWIDAGDDPQDVTAASGDPGAFSAYARGLPTPTVQWQVSTNEGSTWSNVGGATANTYTIEAVTGSDDGKLYRARFTNSAGTTTSASAELTVTGT